MRACIVCVILIVAGCSKQKLHTSPCEGATPLEGCGKPCGAANPTDPYCPPGLYCSDKGECWADCIAGENDPYSASRVCSSDGKWSDSSSNNNDDDDNICAEVTVETSRTTPNLMLLVDQSSSMNLQFDETPGTTDTRSRWTAIREMLIGTQAERNAGGGGLVYKFQHLARFGLALYTGNGSEDPNNPDVYHTQCLRIRGYPTMALNNYSSILNAYEDHVRADTPTGVAIHDLAYNMVDANPEYGTAAHGPLPRPASPEDDPTVILLATDGSPDNCVWSDPDDGGEEGPQHEIIRQQVVDKTEEIYGLGIQTYVVGVGLNTVPRPHLQKLANAGIGVDIALAEGTPGAAPFWVTEKPADFESALNGIIGGIQSCVFDLEGTLDLDKACSGVVLINTETTPLQCNSDNGWKVVNESRIEITGDACMRLQSSPDPKLKATFPCDVVSTI